MQGPHTGRACMAESQQDPVQKERGSFPAVANPVRCERDAARAASGGGCNLQPPCLVKMELSPPKMGTPACLMGSGSLEPAEQLRGRVKPSAFLFLPRGAKALIAPGPGEPISYFCLRPCFWGCCPEKKPGWQRTFTVGFVSLPGEQQDKNETLTAILLFPHHIRESTSSWEIPRAPGHLFPSLSFFSQQEIPTTFIWPQASSMGSCCRGL